MRYRRVAGFTGVLLVIGLGFIVIGSLAIAASAFDPQPVAPAMIAAREPGRSDCPCHVTSQRRGVHLRLEPGPPDAPLALAPLTTSKAPERDEPPGEWDARNFLLQTASAARRRPLSRLWSAETETALWVNDPTVVGSTSRS